MPTAAELALSLDRLAVSFGETPGSSSGTDFDNVPSVTRAAIATRFPDFGLYAISAPLDLGGDGMTGDAIDDLLDLTNDLRQALGIATQVSEVAAIGHLYLLAFHWMRHLRELSLYLHATRFDQ